MKSPLNLLHNPATACNTPLKALKQRARVLVSRTIWTADWLVFCDLDCIEERIYFAAFQAEAKANWLIRRLPAKPRRALSTTFAAARATFHADGIAADRAIHFVYLRSTQPLLDLSQTSPPCVALVPGPHQD